MNTNTNTIIPIQDKPCQKQMTDKIIVKFDDDDDEEIEKNKDFFERKYGFKVNIHADDKIDKQIKNLFIELSTIYTHGEYDMKHYIIKSLAENKNIKTDDKISNFYKEKKQRLISKSFEIIEKSKEIGVEIQILTDVIMRLIVYGWVEFLFVYKELILLREKEKEKYITLKIPSYNELQKISAVNLQPFIRDICEVEIDIN